MSNNIPLAFRTDTFIHSIANHTHRHKQLSDSLFAASCPSLLQVHFHTSIQPDAMKTFPKYPPPQHLKLLRNRPTLNCTWWNKKMVKWMTEWVEELSPSPVVSSAASSAAFPVKIRTNCVNRITTTNSPVFLNAVVRQNQPQQTKPTHKKQGIQFQGC